MNTPAQQAPSNTFLFPPGRLVQGDLYEPNTKDMKGNPLTTKNGANAGQPRVEYFFKYATPKTRALWWEEPWGQQVLALANSYWPQGQTASPKFAWKIEDGDSTEANFDRGGRKNCETEGFAGCWVIKFSSGYATKIFDAQANPLLQPGLVKKGFWIEVMGTINSNEDPTRPGIYINHNMVAFRGIDKEIMSGPDPRTAGFGQAPLPAGVTGAPVGSAVFPSTVATPGAPVTPGAVPAAGYPSSGATPAAPGRAPVTTPAATPVAVQPNPSFIAPPGAGVPSNPAPPPPAAPAPPVPAADPLGAPPGFRMANPAGAQYAQFKANGWDDAAMIANGHMVRL